MEEMRMRRSLIELRVGAVLAIPGVLLALPACGPQPGVSKADEITTPAAPPAPAGGVGVAQPGSGAPKAVASTSARPIATASQPSSTPKTAASPVPPTGNARVPKAAAAPRQGSQGDGPWPQFRGP